MLSPMIIFEKKLFSPLCTFLQVLTVVLHLTQKDTRAEEYNINIKTSNKRNF